MHRNRKSRPHPGKTIIKIQKMWTKSFQLIKIPPKINHNAKEILNNTPNWVKYFHINIYVKKYLESEIQKLRTETKGVRE